MQAFDRLRELGDNWDTYGAPKPSEDAIKMAETLVALIPQCYGTSPGTFGGVSLIVATPGKSALIEIYNDGAVLWMLSKNGERLPMQELESLPPDQVNEFARKIVEFFDGE